MIEKELFTGDSGIKLVRTFSTDNNRLRQLETDTVYGSSAIDVIEGYENGKPYSRFTYTETNEKDESIATE